MNQISDWINTIIGELVNPDVKLQDTLLKVQVLAFKIKSDNLKIWVENELGGMIGKDVPKYRIIPTVVYGNLEQRYPGGIMSRNNQPLPIEYLQKDLRDELMVIEMRASVAELQNMVDSKGNYQIDVPHIIHAEITKLLSKGWVVISAYSKISLNSIHGIIDSIKSNLLKFLLELAEEVGEQENINIMKHKGKIDKIFDKTIGNLTGETINITIGTDNIQSVNTGDNSNLNVAKGRNVKQTIDSNFKEEASKTFQDLKDRLNDIPLDPSDKEDIQTEIARTEIQLSRENPKYNIVNESIKTITGILIGVTANIWTPTIIENLTLLSSKLHF